MDFDNQRSGYSADDFIKANGQAEAAELSRTRDALRTTDEAMQEMRRVNLNNIELQEKLAQQLTRMEDLLDAAKGAADEARAAAKDARSAVESGKEPKKDDTKELVEKLSADISEKLQSMQSSQSGAGEIKEEVMRLGASIEDTIHKEDVKVYKNVQASVDKSLEDQTKKLTEELTEVVEDNQPNLAGVYILLVLTFLVSAANLAIWIIDYLGFLSY